MGSGDGCRVGGYDLGYARRAMMVLVSLPLVVMYTEAVLILVFRVFSGSFMLRLVLLVGFLLLIC